MDHQILLRKMSMYGLSKNVCKWFENYFTDRTQYTRVGNVLSSGVSLEQGVYQGSPLGPLLFIMYINDIVRVDTTVFYNMYADDTVIVKKDTSIHNAVEGNVIVFSRVQDWCKLNNIRVNVKKTKHMVTGCSDKECSVVRTWGEKGVASVENFIYLGPGCSY